MAILLPYHPSLIEILRAQPGKGRGHSWLFRVAIHLRHYHTETACFRLLRECANQWPDRAVPDAEIAKTVRKAYAAVRDDAGGPGAVPWPAPSPAAIARVLHDTEPKFTTRPIEDLGAGRLLPALFEPDELVCAGYSQTHGRTAPLREFQADASRFQFIVPSPMTATLGRNQEGEESFRCLANTGPRRFLVVENDVATKEDQARILTHLGEFLPLVLVLDSGGKSLHGWYWAAGLPETTVRLVMEYAVTLGADPHTFARCQWVRMPGGTRYPEDAAARPQPVVYAHTDILAEVAS